MLLLLREKWLEEKSLHKSYYSPRLETPSRCAKRDHLKTQQLLHREAEAMLYPAPRV